MSLDGVEGRGDTGVQAGEEGGQGEGSSRGRERGANSRDSMYAELPWKGISHVSWAGEGRQGKGGSQVSGL